VASTSLPSSWCLPNPKGTHRWPSPSRPRGGPRIYTTTWDANGWDRVRTVTAKGVGRCHHGSRSSGIAIRSAPLHCATTAGATFRPHGGRRYRPSHMTLEGPPGRPSHGPPAPPGTSTPSSWPVVSRARGCPTAGRNSSSDVLQVCLAKTVSAGAAIPCPPKPEPGST